MAQRAMVIVSALALFAMLSGRASAQSLGCTTAVVSLAPCLGYITGNSSAPSASCCSQLASVVKTQAQCLCTVLNGSAASSLGITLNQTQALALPGACKVQTPPVSQCNAAAAGPAATPPEAPSVSGNPAPETPSTPSAPSNPAPETPSTPTSVPSGSKTVPSTTSGQSSDGGSNKSRCSTVFAVLFLATFISSLTNL